MAERKDLKLSTPSFLFSWLYLSNQCWNMFIQYFSCFLLRDWRDFCLTFIYLTKREDKPLLQISFSATCCLSEFHPHSSVVRCLLREAVPSHTCRFVQRVLLGWRLQLPGDWSAEGVAGLPGTEFHFPFLLLQILCSFSCFSQSVFVSAVLVAPRRMVFISLSCFTGTFMSK